jgi:hypothetical protein
MRSWAARGPPSAHVTAVETRPAEGEFDRFETRPTA